MNNLFCLFTLIFLSSSILQKNALAQGLSWPTLNSTLQNVVQDQIDNSDFLKNGYVKFDESKSDLAKGQLDLSFEFNSEELTLLSSRLPQTIDLSGQILVKKIDLGSLKKVNLDAKINLKGETLVILKHINELFSDCTNVDLLDQFQTHFCSYVLQTTNAKNTGDLQPAFESLNKALLELFVSSPDDDVLKGLLKNLNINKVNDKTVVSALVNNLNLFGVTLSGEISLTFSDDEVILSVSGAALLNQKDYDAYVKDLESVLVKFQNKDQGTISFITRYSSFIFELLEGIFL